MSVATDLADAIVAQINAGTYTQEFEARRRAVPFVEAKDLQTVQVTVFTGPKKAARRTRHDFARTYKPVVAVQKKLSAASEATKLVELDELQTLAEAIETQLEDADYGGLSFVSFNEELEQDTYGIEFLRNQGVFSVPIVLEFTD